MASELAQEESKRAADTQSSGSGQASSAATANASSSSGNAQGRGRKAEDENDSGDDKEEEEEENEYETYLRKPPPVDQLAKAYIAAYRAFVIKRQRERESAQQEEKPAVGSHSAQEVAIVAKPSADCSAEQVPRQAIDLCSMQSPSQPTANEPEIRESRTQIVVDLVSEGD